MNKAFNIYRDGEFTGTVYYNAQTTLEDVQQRLAVSAPGLEARECYSMLAPAPAGADIVQRFEVIADHGYYGGFNVYSPSYDSGEFFRNYASQDQAIAACVQQARFHSDNPLAVVDYGDGDRLPSVTLIARA